MNPQTIEVALHHDRGLAASGCRAVQVEKLPCLAAALPLRVTDSQVFPAPVQLVKLQLHRWPYGFQYAGSRDWSFGAKAEVRWEVSSNQAHTGGSGLSRCGGLVLP